MIKKVTILKRESHSKLFEKDLPRTHPHMHRALEGSRIIFIISKHSYLTQQNIELTVRPTSDSSYFIDLSDPSAKFQAQPARADLVAPVRILIDSAKPDLSNLKLTVITGKIFYIPPETDKKIAQLPPNLKAAFVESASILIETAMPISDIQFHQRISIAPEFKHLKDIHLAGGMLHAQDGRDISDIPGTAEYIQKRKTGGNPKP